MMSAQNTSKGKKRVGEKRAGITGVCIASFTTAQVNLNLLLQPVNKNSDCISIIKSPQNQCQRLNLFVPKTCRWLRQHPRILQLPWKTNVKRSEKSNVIDQLVSGIHEFVQLNDENYWNTYFTENVQPFSLEERREWLSKLTDVVVSSDAFFPFRDNIDCAKQFGVKFIASPGGSTRDKEVIEAADQHQMVLIHTGLRLFHH